MTESVIAESTQLERKRSHELYQLSCSVMPKGVNSPVRAFPGLDQTPLVVRSGRGDLIVDEDGHEYIDLCSSWGALLHGHAHPDILEAVLARCAQGTSFGITTSIEAELAKKVVDLVPAIESVRFVSSGTEATMTAIRLARGYTGRDKIVKFAGNYHGHSDALLVKAGSGASHLAASAGVPQGCIADTLVLPFNDVNAIRSLLQSEKVAAVIVEPIAANMGVVAASHEFLEVIREETKRQGALLIFDEVITGFRVALGGAEELCGVRPDLVCLGKIVGGGFPAAAFGGRQEVMEMIAPLGPVYQAGTLSGNPVAMEAGLQTILLAESEGFYEELEAKTEIITKPIEDLIKRKGLNACINQVGSLFTLFLGIDGATCFDDVVKNSGFDALFHHLFNHGVYVSPSPYEANFIGSAHTHQHLEKVRDLYLEFLDR